MTEVMAPGRLYHPDDHVVMVVDIEDCPVADVPLTEIYDIENSVLIDSYLSVLKTYIVQQLEDTIWLDDQSTTPLFDAGFAIFYQKADGAVQSLRKPALQRLIDQTIRNRPNVSDPVRVEILIRFQIPISKLPRQSRSPPTIPSVVGGRNDDESDRRESQAGVSGIQSSAPHDDSALGTNQNQTDAGLQFVGPPLLDDVTDPSVVPAERTSTAGTNFRGIPVDVPDVAPRTPRPRFDDDGMSHPEQMSRTAYHAPTEPRGPRGRLAFHANDGGTPRTQFTHASGRSTNSHAPLTYGAESFEDYMRQFMSSEVKYKDFRKTIVQKYDSSRQDSFIPWYKLFCATCLQWGLWCPPYESVEQDNVYGSWWLLLPASVRAQDTFMSSLLYGVLSQESVFPAGSKEHSAVQGCAANAGYDAIYSLLRLHHPRLQVAIHTVNEIPRQRRAEQFSSYLRRLQDFLARERIAGRNYSEYEALDLSVRNLASEWRAEFRRLVERDRRTGRTEDTLPFHLTMSQLATTFVQYSIEIGRDVTAPPPTNSRDRYSASTPLVRRIETAPSPVDAIIGTTDSLGEQEMDLLVRAMSQNQANSATCLGCRQTGHTLLDCNRFVDYIVAESLAQRHPQLKHQVAAAHSQFRSRLNMRNADGRPPVAGAHTVRSLVAHSTAPPNIHEDETTSSSYPDSGSSQPTADDDDEPRDGYQLNALRGSSRNHLTTSTSASSTPAFGLVTCPSPPPYRSSSLFVATPSPIHCLRISLWSILKVSYSVDCLRHTTPVPSPSSPTLITVPWRVLPVTPRSFSRTARCPIPVPRFASSTPVVTIIALMVSVSFAFRHTAPRLCPMFPPITSTPLPLVVSSCAHITPLPFPVSSSVIVPSPNNSPPTATV